MKLFSSSDMEVIKYCQTQFSFELCRASYWLVAPVTFW